MSSSDMEEIREYKINKRNSLKKMLSTNSVITPTEPSFKSQWSKGIFEAIKQNDSIQ